MGDPRLSQARMELDQAELLVPFFQHLIAELADEDLAAGVNGLPLELKLRLLQPLLAGLSPEEWGVIGQLMNSLQGGD